MRHVHLLDTSVASDNLGDEIIVSEAREFVADTFGDCYLSSSSSHDGLGHYGRQLAASADLVLMLGTNALTGKYQRRGHFVWTVGYGDMAALAGKVVLVGVGASTSDHTVRPRQGRLLRRLLSGKHRQSVRDATAKTLLDNAGIAALNTSCVTLWRYVAAQPQVPSGRAPAVVFTLTKHKASPHDVKMIDSLRQCYDRLYFWPQQMRDLPYLHQITDTQDITILPANLDAYDNLLATTDVDVVGTRLHGGIRGLRHGRRSLIVVIDNRARDIGTETGLPTIARDQLGAPLVQRLTEGFQTQLSLPTDAIAAFKAQFNA